MDLAPVLADLARDGGDVAGMAREELHELGPKAVVPRRWRGGSHVGACPRPHREAVMTILRRIPFMVLAGAASLSPFEAAAQPVDPQAQLRETARAVEECAKRGCGADGMQIRLAALKAAQVAFEATLAVSKEAPVAPDLGNDESLVREVPSPEPVVDREFEREPEAVEPWLPPPAYRPGAAPYPPADLSEGSVQLRREPWASTGSASAWLPEARSAFSRAWATSAPTPKAQQSSATSAPASCLRRSTSPFSSREACSSPTAASSCPTREPP
jgi:hypothetical protein